MDILKNEIFSREVVIGALTIEYSVIDKDGCRVTFTAKDVEHRRIWRTELTDAEGNAKVYSTVQEAIADANRKLNRIAAIEHRVAPTIPSSDQVL